MRVDDRTIKFLAIFAIFASVQVNRGQTSTGALLPTNDEQSGPTQARVLVQEGRELLRQGKKEDAEQKFKQAMKIDSQNKEAFDVLKPLKEERFREELRRRRALEGRIILGEGDPWRSYSFSNGVPRLWTNHLAGSTPREKLQRKLEWIILPDWNVPQEMEFSEVLKRLHKAAVENDPEQTGVPFMISNKNHPPLSIAEGPIYKVEDALITIEQPMRNVRLLDVITAVVKGARWDKVDSERRAIDFRVSDGGVIFMDAIEVEVAPVWFQEE